MSDIWLLITIHNDFAMGVCAGNKIQRNKGQKCIFIFFFKMSHVFYSLFTMTMFDKRVIFMSLLIQKQSKSSNNQSVICKYFITVLMNRLSHF